MKLPLFHLAFPVTDLVKARAFYGGLLGCREGRSSAAWVDFDFYGHQIVAHLAPAEAGHRASSAVDGDAVPVRHFGVILPMREWEALAAKLKAAGTRFVIEPHVRFKGQVGEQATIFFLDPCQCPGVQGVRRSRAGIRHLGAVPRLTGRETCHYTARPSLDPKTRIPTGRHDA